MDMSGSDSMGSDAACKISMLWNFYTVDSCFLSESWHNHSKGAFAATVIGIFLWTAVTEAVRRFAREYDRRLLARHATVIRSANSSTPELSKTDSFAAAPIPFKPTWSQQIVRGLLHGVQFASAFLIMLLGMYYNGYVLFAIFIGATLGYIVFGADTLTSPHLSKNDSSCC